MIEAKKLYLLRRGEPLPIGMREDALYIRAGGGAYCCLDGQWSRVDTDLMTVLAMQGNRPSLRMVLKENIWTRVDFPLSCTIIPNISIICYAYNVERAEVNYNRRISSYELRTATISGFEIRVKEPCVMQLDIFPVDEQLDGVIPLENTP